MSSLRQWFDSLFVSQRSDTDILVDTILNSMTECPESWSIRCTYFTTLLGTCQIELRNTYDETALKVDRIYIPLTFWQRRKLRWVANRMEKNKERRNAANYVKNVLEGIGVAK